MVVNKRWNNDVAAPSPKTVLFVNLITGISGQLLVISPWEISSCPRWLYHWERTVSLSGYWFCKVKKTGRKIEEIERKVQKTERNVQKTERNVQKTKINVQKTKINVQKTERNVQITERGQSICLDTGSVNWEKSSKKWEKCSENWEKCSENWEKIQTTGRKVVGPDGSQSCLVDKLYVKYVIGLERQ